MTKLILPSPTTLSTHALRLQTLLSTPTGLDASLTTTTTSLTLLHALLLRALQKQYERIALALVNQTSLDTEKPVPLHAPQTRLSEWCAGVQSAAELSGDVRVALRLTGLLGVYKRAYGAWGRTPRDPGVKALVWGKVLCDAVWIALENVAFLGAKGVLRGVGWEDGTRAEKWMRLSAQWWMASLVLDLLRLGRVRQLGWREELGAQTMVDGEGEKEVKTRSQRLEKRWFGDVVADAAWLPITLHWSYEDESRSPIDETWVGLLGMISGIARFRQVWEETA